MFFLGKKTRIVKKGENTFILSSGILRNAFWLESQIFRFGSYTLCLPNLKIWDSNKWGTYFSSIPKASALFEPKFQPVDF